MDSGFSESKPKEASMAMVAGKSLYLKKNVGPAGQVFRLTLGVALIAIPVLLQWSPWTIAVLAAIGGAQILEGIIAY